MTKLAMIRPEGLIGETSPYPTVVTVWSAHHIPTQTFGYSSWSSAQIRTPLPTTTSAVAETITPVAKRTDGGSRRMRANLRSRNERAAPSIGGDQATQP